MNSPVRFRIFCLIIVLHVTYGKQFTNINSQQETNYITSEINAGDPGQPLFLTPLIVTGQLDLALNLSRVNNLPGINNNEVVSFSGYLTVNQLYNSNMFFWFFLTKNNPEEAPVFLWLQGGPGVSDQTGLFQEIGPFYVDENLTLHLRNYTWNTNYNLLFIDNPVGTGFSFTESEEGYATNEDMVARDLYEAISQFFTLFHSYANNDFYIAGESYAGKYVPSIAYEIFTKNPAAEQKINLQGISIGNGLIDPETMYNYADFLYNIGLIDESVRLIYQDKQSEMISLIKAGEYRNAFYIFDYLVNGDFTNQSLFLNTTGMHYYLNFLHSENYINENSFHEFLEIPSVRSAIHVGNLTNHDPSYIVESHFLDDFMNSTKPLVETLLDNDYKVILYNGQLDIIVPYVFTDHMVNSMQWKYSDEFRNAQRIIWKVDENDREIAGYVKQVQNFTLVLVRNAGHLAPYDQPRAVFDLISRFQSNKPFV